MRLTARQITEPLSPHLSLYASRGPGGTYWYFVFDDGVRFETHSVLTPRLSDLSRDRWQAEAREFLGRVADFVVT